MKAYVPALDKIVRVNVLGGIGRFSGYISYGGNGYVLRRYDKRALQAREAQIFYLIGKARKAHNQANPGFRGGIKPCRA